MGFHLAGHIPTEVTKGILAGGRQGFQKKSEENPLLWRVFRLSTHRWLTQKEYNFSQWGISFNTFRNSRKEMDFFSVQRVNSVKRWPNSAPRKDRIGQWGRGASVGTELPKWRVLWFFYFMPSWGRPWGVAQDVFPLPSSLLNSCCVTLLTGCSFLSLLPWARALL